MLALVVGTFAHEFGHALAAWAVGLQPRLISIGRGPILGRLRLSGAWVIVRLVPVTGFTHALIGPETSATQRFVTTAGGPFATLLLLVATILFGLAAPLSAIGRDLLEGWAIGQAFILASSVIPSERKTKGAVSTTDAMRLYRIARGQFRESFATLHAALLRPYVPEGAGPPPPSRHLPEIIFQRTRRDRKQDAWAQDDVAASMRHVLAQGDLPEAERKLADDLLALSVAHQRVRAAKAELAALRRGR